MSIPGTGILFIVAPVYCDRYGRLKGAGRIRSFKLKGVVITGGEAPEPNIITRYASLCGLCIAADSGLDTALSSGIVPDYAVGDMDSISDPSVLDRLPARRVVRMPRDKDLTDTELALALLREKGCDESILIGGGGGRLDHLLALRALFENRAAPYLWVGHESLAAGIGEAFPCRTIDLGRVDPEAPISVFPCGTAPHRLEGSGLRWPIVGLSWDAGAYSLSNRRMGDDCRLRAVSGSFLVILAADADFSLR